MPASWAHPERRSGHNLRRRLLVHTDDNARKTTTANIKRNASIVMDSHSLPSGIQGLKMENCKVPAMARHEDPVANQLPPTRRSLRLRLVSMTEPVNRLRRFLSRFPSEPLDPVFYAGSTDKGKVFGVARRVCDYSHGRSLSHPWKALRSRQEDLFGLGISQRSQ